MSRFFTEKYAALVPYTPGEQPQDMQYLKLNTNESPFPPSEQAAAAAMRECQRSRLYSDPECVALRGKMAELYGVQPAQVLMTNGSDEALNFAFMAFADESRPLMFPDITYGFYPVFAQLNHIPYTEVPLLADFTVDVPAFLSCGGTVVIANPNAPTGIGLPLAQIEAIVKSNPETVVIVDEAYIDFGGESAVRLIGRYNNLIVIGTFSKSRSMAGARLGFAIADAALIADMNTIKYSTNPYNVNRMTAAAGVAALEDNAYYMENCRTIMQNRAWTAAQLERLGFEVLPSQANFLFAKSNKIGGEALYQKLKQNGVLIRHFTKERIKDYNRITIGTAQQMQRLIDEVTKILKEC